MSARIILNHLPKTLGVEFVTDFNSKYCKALVMHASAVGVFSHILQGLESSKYVS